MELKSEENSLKFWFGRDDKDPPEQKDIPLGEFAGKEQKDLFFFVIEKLMDMAGEKEDGCIKMCSFATKARKALRKGHECDAQKVCQSIYDACNKCQKMEK